MIIFAFISQRANFNYSILKLVSKIKKIKFKFSYQDYLNLYNFNNKLTKKEIKKVMNDCDI